MRSQRINSTSRWLIRDIAPDLGQALPYVGGQRRPPGRQYVRFFTERPNVSGEQPVAFFGPV